MVEKIIGMELQGLSPGQMFSMRQGDFQRLWDCVLPLIDERPFALFLLRMNITGWQLWGTNGGAGDPDTALHYELVAISEGFVPYVETATPTGGGHG